MKLPLVLRALMEKEAHHRETRPWHYGFHNAAHPCLRKLYLEATGTRQSLPDLRTVFTAAVGHAVGSMVEQAALDVGGSAQVYCKLDTGEPVSAEGHADIVFVSDDEVIDVKVVGESPWSRMEIHRSASPEHVYQVNGYTVALKRARWQLWYLRGISIFRPGELEWRTYSGNASLAKAAGINHRWATLASFVERRLLPPIPGGFTRDVFPCGWCGYQEMCYPDANTKQKTKEKTA